MTFQESKRHLKVVQCIARMNVGGPAVIIHELMTGLAESTDSLLIHGRCAEDEQEFLESVETSYRTEVISELGRAVRFGDDIKALWKLRRLLVREKPDILHTHTFKAGILGRIAARTILPRPKLVHTFHGHLLVGYFGPTTTRLLISLERRLAAWTDSFIAVGSNVADDLAKAGIGDARKYVVIPPGIPAPKLASTLSARQLLGLEEDQFIIAFIGRLTAIKNVGRFLHALMFLEFPFQAIIVGDGDDRKSAEEFVQAHALSDKVKFFGWVHDVNPVYDAADVVVLTSDNEGTPLCLMEAQLHGTSIVSTDVGSIQEILLELGDFQRLTPLNPRDVGAAVTQIYKSDTDTRRKNRTTLSLKAREVFASSKMCSRHLSLYQNLAEGSWR